MCFAVLIPALLHRLLCCLGYIIQKALWIYQNECTFLRFDESLQESLERPREMCYTEFVSSKIFFSFSPGEIHPEAVQTVKNSDFVIAQPAHTLVVAIEGCFACPCSCKNLKHFEVRLPRLMCIRLQGMDAFVHMGYCWSVTADHRASVSGCIAHFDKLLLAML